MEKINPFEPVYRFEKQLEAYTRADYAICVSSCTEALGLCFEWHKNTVPEIILPKRTYIGVAMQAKRAGLKINFEDIDWNGSYQIGNTNIWDCARAFHNGIFDDGYGPDNSATRFKCVSFHRTKILGFMHGGAILTNSRDFAEWAKAMRVDGRDFTRPMAFDNPKYLGRHCYMDPAIAAALSARLSYLPLYNKPLPNDLYPDLSQMSIFK